MNEPVRLIATGGTIDEVSQDADGKSIFSDSFVPIMLKQGIVTAPVAYDILMLKDSRDITDVDREAMLQRCALCDEKRIVITHGTFTMPDTAKYLGSRISNKTVVLTGAAVPFPKEKSDAHFNLGFALASAQLLPAGVYVAMNGKVFNWNNVKKDLNTGTFENR